MGMFGLWLKLVGYGGLLLRFSSWFGAVILGGLGVDASLVYPWELVTQAWYLWPLLSRPHFGI
jgi:hypothetical protein